MIPGEDNEFSWENMPRVQQQPGANGDAPLAPQDADSPTWADHLKHTAGALLRGAGDVVEGGLDLGQKLGITSNLGGGVFNPEAVKHVADQIGGAGNQAATAIDNTMTPAAQRINNGPFDPSKAASYGFFAEDVGGQLAPILATAGMGEAAEAEKAPEVASRLARYGQKLLPTTVSGATGFIQATGATAQGAKDSVAQAPIQQLMASPKFIEILAAIDKDPASKNLSDSEKVAKGREQLGDYIAMQDIADPKMLAANLFASRTGDEYLASMWAGDALKQSLGKTLLKGGLREGAVNAGVSGVSQLTQNQGNIDNAGYQGTAFDGVSKQIMNGFLQGLALSTLTGVGGHARKALGERAQKQIAAADGGDPDTATPQTSAAESEIQQGAEQVAKGADELRGEIQPQNEADIFTRGFSEPDSAYKDGLTKKERARQEKLLNGFEAGDKFGGNRPDDFADQPAYLRNSRLREIIDDDSELQQHLGSNNTAPSPADLVNAQGEKGTSSYRNIPIKAGNVEAHFDNDADAGLFEMASKLNDFDKSKNPAAEDHSHALDWLHGMSQKGRHSEGELKNIALGYYNFVMDAAKNAENGQFHAPSIEDFAEHTYQQNPLKLEDKNIIYAGGPGKKPVEDERQSGREPEFSRGEYKGQQFIPADRQANNAGGVRNVQTIDGELDYPRLEDKGIIFAGGPGNDDKQAGRAPDFSRGKTDAQRKLDRIEAILGIKRRPGLMDNSPKTGGQSIPRNVSDTARSGNDRLVVRKNGKPYPSQGLARLSKPFTEAKEEGLKPQVVSVDGGYAVEVPAEPEVLVKKKENQPLKESPSEQTAPVAGLPIDIRPEDVPYNLALDAYAGSSMSPEKRALQEQQGYVDTIRNLHDDMKEMANSPDNEKRIPRLLQSYRDGYLPRLKDYLSSRSGTLSALVTGRAKFPTKQNEARLKREDGKLQALTDWDTQRRKSIKEILTSVTPDQKKKKLQTQLKANEAALVKMNQVNAVIKSGKDVEPSLKEMGFNDQQIKELLFPRSGPAGFDSTQISCMKQTIKKLSKQLAPLTPAQTSEPPAPKETSKPAKTSPVNISSPDDHSAFFQRIFRDPNSVTPDQVREGLESTIANKPAIVDAFQKLTKDQLQRYSSGYPDPRAKKDRMVENAYTSLLNNYRGLATSGPMLISQHGKSAEQHAREDVANLSQDQIRAYVDQVKENDKERQQRAEGLKKSITDPQTLDDFKQFFHYRGKSALTPELAERYDKLVADTQLDRQKKKSAAPAVKQGFEHDDELKINPITEGKNSRTGETLYNVNLETRLGPEKFKEAAKVARQMGGGYWRGNFHFPTEERTEQFVSWLKGDDVDFSAAQEQREAAKKENQTSSLSGLADKLEADANDRLSADRLTNTSKRATQAAHATGQAERDVQFAQTLRLIAQGVEDGTVKYLAELRNKTQLSTLRSIMRGAIYNIPRDKVDDLIYTTRDGQRDWNDDVTATQKAKHAHFPMLSWRDETFNSILKEMQQTPGYKMAAVELGRVKPDAQRYVQLPEGRKANDKLYDFLTQKHPERYGDTTANYQRLQRMGVTTRPLMRAALIELEDLHGQTKPAEVPKLQQLEQGLKMKVLSNRNAFNDFFPTPESFADHVMEQADIHPGMDVLEPSAGNGVLADAARNAGGKVDVVELAGDLRDILKEKDHNVVGDDFDAFQPEKHYDRIVMNPPFSNDMDIQHVMKAYEHLKPGGKLTAIVSGMAGDRANKRNQAFREWLDDLGAEEEKLPAGLFKDSLNPTSIATKLITLEKTVRDDVNFSRTQARRNGMTVPEVIKLVEDFEREYHGNIPLDFDIYPTQEVAYGPQATRAKKGRIQGAYHGGAGGRVILAAASLRDAEDARRTLRHEILGHYGLNTFAPADKEALLARIIASRSDPALGNLWKEIDRLYSDKNESMRAEEVFARAAERKSGIAGQAWTKILANVHKLLRKVGLSSAPITGAELLDTVNSIARGIRRGDRPQRIFPQTDQDQFRLTDPQDALNKEGVFVYEPGVSPRKRILNGAADFEPRGMTKKQVEDEAKRFLKRWNGAGGLDIQVAQDVAETEKLAGFKMPDGARVHAMHLPNSGRVILLADNLDSLSHVRAKLRHEILGHHALSEVVGPAEYEKLLQTIAKGQHSKSLKPYFDRVLDNYDAAEPYKQVEEVISHVLEDADRGVLGRAWDRVSGAVLQALRKSGFLSDENITTAEVRSLMAPIATRLKKVGIWAEHNGAGKEHMPVNFSLLGDDGLLTKPRPGESENQATQRRAVNFSHVLSDTFKDVRALEPGSVINRLKAKASEFRPIMMALLTTRQMADVYGKVMKTDYAGNYQDFLTKMEAYRNRIMHKAESKIDSQWNGLKRDESRALSDVMIDSTMYGVHPDKPLAEQKRFQSLKNEQTRLKARGSRGDEEGTQQARLKAVTNELDAMRDNYADLSQRYQALSPAAKKLFGDTESWYKTSFNDMKEALIQRINDIGGGEKAALISKIREQFERALDNGPYFPLARFGKYVVVAKKEGEFIREHFENKFDAVQAAKQYRELGYDALQTVKADVNGTNADSANTLGKSILALINEEGAGGELDKDKLNDQIWQMMLELMPDASYAKHAIRRHRTKGASRDARRAFADSSFHFAFHISKIKYGHKMQALMDDMGNEIDAAGKGNFVGVSPENLEVAQQVLDEMKKRHEMTMNPTGAAWAGHASGLSYLWTMFANVSSAVVNMTQTALVALPQMAARYGWKNAIKALTQATLDYAKSPDKRFSWLGKDAWISLSRNDHLPADERALIQRLRDDGVIEITQAATLAQHAENDSQSKVNLPRWMENANTIGGQFFHNAEVFNREVTALAAYRLASDAAGGHISPEDAIKIARKAVYDGHFDYTSSNRPRWMRKDWQKVIFQYKMFAQSMYYTLARSFAQSIKGETPEIRRQATKEFMGYMLMHTLGAGVLGLPSAVTACFTLPAQAIHAVFSDDDQPWDPEVALQNWLHDEIGGFASTALTKGMFNAMGLDIGSRIGLSDMLWRSAPDSLEGQDRYMFYLQEMLGPLIGGTFTNFFKGAAQGMNGDWLRGVQTMAPAGVKSIVKAYREGTEGETTQTGEEVVPASDFTTFELAAQALGFSPVRISQAYDSRTAIKNAQGELSGKRSELIQQYFSNVMNQSSNEGVEQDIANFNRSNPTNAITGDVLHRAVQQKRKSRLRKERGLALSRKDEHLRELGRFGNYDPLL